MRSSGSDSVNDAGLSFGAGAILPALFLFVLRPEIETSRKEDATIKQPRIRVNEMIRVPEVRLITAEGEQLGIVPIEEALKRAKEATLDLVEVAPLAKPPVCKIIDYGKVLFDQRQKMKAQKKKQHQVAIKEIKLKLKIDKHDYETKVRQAIKFIEHGDKVKFTIVFRGREVTHQELGRELSDRVLEDVKGIAELEGLISRAGRLHSFLVMRRKDYKSKTDAKKSSAAAAAAEGGTLGEMVKTAMQEGQPEDPADPDSPAETDDEYEEAEDGDEDPGEDDPEDEEGEESLTHGEEGAILPE